MSAVNGSSRWGWSLLAVAAVLGGLWWLHSRAHDESHRRRRRPTYVYTSMVRSGTAPTALFGPGGGLVPGLSQPMIIANMAAVLRRDIVVAVRQIFAEDRVRSLLDPPAPPGAVNEPPGRCRLVLQVYAAPGTQDPGPVVIKSLLIEDETGKSQTLDTSDRATVRVPGYGFGQVDLTLPAAGARARHLRRLALRVLYADHEDAVSFTGVPLPGFPRLFGEVSLLSLRESPDGRNPRPSVHVGWEAEDLLRHAVPASELGTLPPMRLAVVPGHTYELPLLHDVADVRMSIAASDTPEGLVRLTGLANGWPWSARVWDMEPVALIVGNGSNRSFAIRIAVNRTMEPVPMPLPRLSFRATPGRPTGSLALRALARGRPLGPALIPFSICRWEGVSWSAPQSDLAPIYASGACTLPNIPPGRYRIRFEPERLSPLSQPRFPSVREYLRARYGISNVSWHGVEQVFEVAPGRRTYVTDLVCAAGAQGTSDGR